MGPRFVITDQGPFDLGFIFSFKPWAIIIQFYYCHIIHTRVNSARVCFYFISRLVAVRGQETFGTMHENQKQFLPF